MTITLILNLHDINILLWRHNNIFTRKDNNYMTFIAKVMSNILSYTTYTISFTLSKSTYVLLLPLYLLYTCKQCTRTYKQCTLIHPHISIIFWMYKTTKVSNEPFISIRTLTEYPFWSLRIYPEYTRLHLLSQSVLVQLGICIN